MKQFLFLLALIFSVTFNVCAQHNFVIEFRNRSYVYINPDPQYFHIQLQAWKEAEIRDDGLYLSWVGGPHDPYKRFIPLGGGDGGVDIFFDPPIKANRILVSSSDYSAFPSPGMELIATFQQQFEVYTPYTPTATLSGHIHNGHFQPNDNMSAALIKGVWDAMGVEYHLTNLRLRASGQDDFIVYAITIESY